MPLTEAFAQIRAQFEDKPLPVEAERHNKVITRNNECFITELPEKWRLDYERRRHHDHTGYFAYNYIPYRTFANLKHTDVCDLISDHLDVRIRKHFGFLQAFNRMQAQCDNVDIHGHDPQLTIRVVCDSDNSSRKTLPPSRNAGLSSLRSSIASSTRGMHSMQAGANFRCMVKTEKEREEFLKEVRQPHTIGGKTELTIHNPSKFLSPMVHRASSKACMTLSDTLHNKLPPVVLPPPGKPGKMTERKQLPSSSHDEHSASKSGNQVQKKSKTGGVGPQLYVALAAVHFKLGHAREQGAAKNCKDRGYLAKLKLIHAILCCLHNMKHRDLKGKEALPSTAIKQLSQKLLHSLNKDQLHHDTLLTHHPHTHHHPHPPSHRRPSHAQHARSHSPSRVMSHDQDFGHHTHFVAAGRFQNHHHQRQGRGTPKHAKLYRGLPMETWEDLLFVHKDGVKAQTTPLSTTPQGHGVTPASHTPQPNVDGSAGNINTPLLPPIKSTRALPPWQRQYIFVDENSKDSKKNPDKQISRCVDAFHQFKSEMAQEVRNTLTNRKDYRERHLSSKLENLELRVNAEQCLEEMRERAFQVVREAREKENEKPAWFRVLEKEVAATGEAKRPDVHIKAALGKLQQFTCVDNDAIPHVLEKLCLIVMSLPANELALRPVDTAIKFVVEHVLKKPVELVVQWKKLRLLPLTTNQLTANTHYAFGMCI